VLSVLDDMFFYVDAAPVIETHDPFAVPQRLAARKTTAAYEMVAIAHRVAGNQGAVGVDRLHMHPTHVIVAAVYHTLYALQLFGQA